MSSINSILILRGMTVLFCALTFPKLLPAQSVPNPDRLALSKWYPTNQVAIISGPAFSSVTSMAFDGKSMWILDVVTPSLIRMRVSDGVITGTFALPYSAYTVAYDGATVWVGCIDGTIFRFRASDGQVVGTYKVGQSPRAITFDGANIWVANSLANTVTKLRGTDGAPLGTYAVGQAPF